MNKRLLLRPVLITSLLAPLLRAAAAGLLATSAGQVSAAVPDAAVPFAAMPFAEWSERFASDWVRLSPEFATATQYLGGEEQSQLDGQLSPLTTAHSDRRSALAREGLAQLDAYTAAGLQGSDYISAAIMRSTLQRSLAARPFEEHNFVFNQLWGPQVRYVSLLAEAATSGSRSRKRRYASALSEVLPSAKMMDL